MKSEKKPTPRPLAVKTGIKAGSAPLGDPTRGMLSFDESGSIDSTSYSPSLGFPANSK